MFCSKCGAQNGDGNAFCVNCGAPFQNNTPAAPVQQAGNYASAGYIPMEQTHVMAPVKKPNYMLIGIIAVVVLAVIVVIIALLLFSGKDSLVGTWTTTEYGSESTITFKANGTTETESDGNIQTGKYKVKGHTLTVITEDGNETSVQFKILKNGGKTALELTVDDDTLTLYKK